MKKFISRCSLCHGEIIVKKIKCSSCGCVIKGNFYLNKFAKLSEQDLEFIEIFVKKRGNIKEIEKKLGISYPTVRNKLDEVITNLGHKVDHEHKSDAMDILEMLKNGSISAEEAAEMIKSKEGTR